MTTRPETTPWARDADLDITPEAFARAMARYVVRIAREVARAEREEADRV